MTYWEPRCLMLKLVFALGALLLSGIAAACYCPYQEEAGFVHANLKRLPANAKGVLFLSPRGEPPLNITEKDFVITSDKQAGTLNAVLSYPMQPTSELVRVGATTGFKPGAHYTIRYVGHSENWAYPLSVDFTVDASTVNTKSLSYRIQLDGPPQRRLLGMGDGRGSCWSNQPVIAQDFHYVLPESLQPYKQAMTYFSETRTAGKFERRSFIKLLCAPPQFGTTAYGEERDLVQVDCTKPGADKTIRGQVGFLEVEDSLQTTAAVNTALSKAEGKACHGMGMLTEALTRADEQQALNLVCQLPYERPYDGFFDPYAKPRRTPKTPAPIQVLRQLAAHATEEQRLCIAKITGEL